MRQYSRRDIREGYDERGNDDSPLFDLMLIAPPLKAKITSDKALADALRGMQTAATEPEVRAQWNQARPLLIDHLDKAGTLDTNQRTALLLRILRSNLGGSQNGSMNMLAMVLLLNGGTLL